MLTQAQWAWERGRAPRGGQCAKDRATARGKKINLIIAVARAGEGQQIPRPSPMVPSWHTKKEKGRFGVGAGLRGQIPDRSPIFRRPGGPSKAPLAYRPTSSRVTWGFLSFLGVVSYRIRILMYSDVSCMYPDRILTCPVHVHQDTSRYIRIQLYL